MMDLDTEQTIDIMNSLIKLDIDATRAYSQAMDNIDVTEVREQLAEFKADHERHITDLSSEIISMGGTPTSPTPDLKGFFIENFTAIRSLTGTEGALKAMRT